MKKELEAEKLNLAAFLKMAARFGLSDDETEMQIDFYLEKIATLKKQLDNQNPPG
ncbi:hypothetical protein [Niabella soli]|uniref:Uncharacterized protein n=1 Tax=Niabella soli DSM 19437 TaxID=929713 RepID=W0F5T1_9BACT|nr:hypothetical protein [Niabella soli]AHF17158.1 hypothetical protein NIASO_02715 [Niabella soli DSM 19437]